MGVCGGEAEEGGFNFFFLLLFLFQFSDHLHLQLQPHLHLSSLGPVSLKREKEQGGRIDEREKEKEDDEILGLKKERRRNGPY